jgi:hypothetical protein
LEAKTASIANPGKTIVAVKTIAIAETIKMIVRAI